MGGRGRRGITLLGLLVLSVLTAIFGVVLLGVTAGWFNLSLLDLTKETDKGVQQIRSILVLEAADFNPETGEITVYLRNVWRMSVIITRVEILSPLGELYHSIPETGFSNLSSIDPMENTTIHVTGCDACGSDKPIMLRVWYIPSGLYNPENPTESIDEMLYLEHMLRGGESTPPPACPLPENWMLIDFMDPIVYLMSGSYSGMIARDYVRFRAPLASEFDVIRLTVTVEELGGRIRSGSGNVRTMANNIQQVDANARGLRLPVLISVRAESPWRVIQGSWFFDAWGRDIHVSDISLIWNERTKMIEQALIALGVDRGGRYQVTVTLKDCNGDIVSTGSVVTEVIPGPQDLWIDVDPVRFDQVYSVETEVRPA